MKEKEELCRFLKLPSSATEQEIRLKLCEHLGLPLNETAQEVQRELCQILDLSSSASREEIGQAIEKQREGWAAKLDIFKPKIARAEEELTLLTLLESALLAEPDPGTSPPAGSAASQAAMTSGLTAEGTVRQPQSVDANSSQPIPDQSPVTGGMGQNSVGSNTATGTKMKQTERVGEEVHATGLAEPSVVSTAGSADPQSPKISGLALEGTIQQSESADANRAQPTDGQSPIIGSPGKSSGSSIAATGAKMKQSEKVCEEVQSTALAEAVPGALLPARSADLQVRKISGLTEEGTTQQPQYAEANSPQPTPIQKPIAESPGQSLVDSNATTDTRMKQAEKAVEVPQPTNTSKHPWYWAEIAIALVVFAFLGVLAARTLQHNAAPIELHVGIYRAFSPSTIHAAAYLGLKQNKLHVSQPPLTEYNILVMPLAAVADFEPTLRRKKWRMIWIPDSSGTKLLKRGYQSGSLRALSHTFGAPLLTLYVNTWCSLGGDPPQDLTAPATGEPSTNCSHREKYIPTDDLQTIENDQNASFIAVANPAAIRQQRNLGPIFVPPNLLQADVNVLLIAPSLYYEEKGANKLRKEVLEFLREIDEAPHNSEVVKEALHYFREPEYWEEQDIQRIADNYQKIGVKENIQFLYKADAHSCTEITKQLGAERNISQVCDLIDEGIARQISAELRDDLEKPVLSDDALRTLCEEQRHFLPVDAESQFPNFAGFVPGHSELPPGTADIIKSIRQRFNKKAKYCILGHGDKEWTDADKNQDVGGQRAKEVRDAVSRHCEMPVPNLFAVGMGGKDLKTEAEGGKFRYVEIKQLDIF